MRYANKILVLDSEATGDLSSPIIYNLGYMILDTNLEPLIKRSYLVSEIYRHKWLMDKSFYYKSKRELYNQQLKSGRVIEASFQEVIKELIYLIKKHKVKTLAAYNISYDNRALNETIKLLSNDLQDKWFKTLNQLNRLCIWDLACDTLLQDTEYLNLAEAESWFTAKGNILTNAEVAYRYLINDTNFIEEHTAFSDVEIEVEILKEILLNRKGNVKYGLTKGKHHKVQKRYKALKTL